MPGWYRSPEFIFCCRISMFVFLLVLGNISVSRGINQRDRALVFTGIWQLACAAGILVVAMVLGP